MGFVLYAHWDGGRVGDSLASALAFALGRVRLGVPVALAAAGMLVVLRALVPSLRPFRAGLLLLFVATTLAFAAGTFGISPASHGHNIWLRAFYERRGGLLGEGELWLAARALGGTGADILALFIAAAGLLLLSGGSLATAARAAAGASADAARSLRLPERPARPAAPIRPPEPADRELIVRATHVEAPAVEQEEMPADFELEATADAFTPLASDEPAEPEGAEPMEIDPALLTPQGRFRASVTEDPGFLWRLPPAGLLTRSSAEQSRPDTAGQERVAARLLEALGHFGVAAKVVGTVAGPHSRATRCASRRGSRSRRSPS